MIFYFLIILVNLFKICHDLELFYEICNTIDQRYQKQIHFLLFFLLILPDIFAKEIFKKFFSDFTCFIA